MFERLQIEKLKPNDNGFTLRQLSLQASMVPAAKSSVAPKVKVFFAMLNVSMQVAVEQRFSVKL